MILPLTVHFLQSRNQVTTAIILRSEPHIKRNLALTSQRCRKRKPWSRMPTGRRRCNRKQWIAQPKHLKNTTSKRTSQLTSKRSWTKRTTSRGMQLSEEILDLMLHTKQGISFISISDIMPLNKHLSLYGFFSHSGPISLSYFGNMSVRKIKLLRSNFSNNRYYSFSFDSGGL